MSNPFAGQSDDYGPNPPPPNDVPPAARKRPPWGHVSRHCVFCFKVGPRVSVAGGYAHRRCIPRGRV